MRIRYRIMSRMVVIALAIIAAGTISMKNPVDTVDETIVTVEAGAQQDTSAMVQEGIEETLAEFTEEVKVEEVEVEEVETEEVEEVEEVEAEEPVSEETTEEFPEEFPEDPSEDYYYIEVNIETQVVTIYTQDDEGEYTNAVKAFICSTGSSTPQSGVYTTSTKYRWHELFYDVYGQYCVRITGNILFHSVPYEIYEDPGSLIAEAYDQLGTDASAGCVRMTVEGVEWIYNHCPSGTQVEFIHRESDPIEVEEAMKISDAEGELSSWDPTDSDPDNPWIEYFESIEQEEE